MTDPRRADATLEREAMVFGRYLLGVPVDRPVVAKYRQAHERSDVLGSGVTRFDEVLVNLASRGVFAAGLCDAYASRLRREGSLRRKLVLLTAILESRGDSARRLDGVDPTSRVVLLAKLFLRMLGYGLRFALVVLWLGPVHLVLGSRGKTP
jgi:hypothetical protein